MPVYETSGAGDRGRVRGVEYAANEALVGTSPRKLKKSAHEL
jgi:hypothetical protein